MYKRAGIQRLALFAQGANNNRESRIVLEKIRGFGCLQPFLFSPGPFTDVEMYLQEAQRGRTVDWKVHGGGKSYLEERLVGRGRRRNLNRVEFLLELGSVVVNVRHVDDDPRGRRQGGPAVVSHRHLEPQSCQSEKRHNNVSCI